MMTAKARKIFFVLALASSVGVLSNAASYADFECSLYQGPQFGGALPSSSGQYSLGTVNTVNFTSTDYGPVTVSVDSTGTIYTVNFQYGTYSDAQVINCQGNTGIVSYFTSTDSGLLSPPINPADVTLISNVTNGTTGTLQYRATGPHPTLYFGRQQYQYYTADGNSHVYQTASLPPLDLIAAAAANNQNICTGTEGSGVCNLSADTVKNPKPREALRQGPTAKDLGQPEGAACVSCGTGQAGDPVDVYSGNYFHDMVDLRVPGIRSLTVNRLYTSGKSDFVGAFGIGSHLGSYNYTLSIPKDANGKVALAPSYQIQLDTGNGSKIAYTTNDGSNVMVNNATPGTTGDSIKLNLNSSNVLLGATYTTLELEKLSFDANGYLIQSQDRFGNSLTFTRNANGNLLSVKEPSANRSITFAYTPDNLIASAQDHTGRTVNYDYDASKQLIRVTNPAGKAYGYTWDNSKRILSRSDLNGVTVFTNTYGPTGAVTQQTDMLGGIIKFDATATSVRKVTDPNGHQRRVDYNDQNLPIISTDPLGHTNKTTYSSNYFTGTTSGRFVEFQDALGNITHVDENAFNLPITVKDPLNQQASITYDTVHPELPKIITDKLGRTKMLSYDAAGNTTQIKDSAGNITSFTYNSKGQLLSSTNALGAKTTYAYNSASNDLATITDPLNRGTGYTFDNLSRLTKMVDPKGNQTAMTYDVLNRLTQVTDPLNKSTQYTYDNNGNLLTATDPNGHVLTYDYDNKNRLVSKTNANGEAITYAYDGVDNLVTVTDPKGQVTTINYDPADRQTQLKFADNTTYTYSYDNGNQLLSVGDGTGTWAFTYDLLGRTTQVSTPAGTLAYAYDANNNRTSLTGPASYGSVAYTYDTLNRLSKVTQNGKSYTYAYDALGRRTSLTRPNTTAVTTYTYDPANQLTELRHKLAGSNPNASIDRLAYGYDGNGNIVTINNKRYQYDALNRLTQFATDPPGDDPEMIKAQYTYDAVGNMIGFNQFKPDGTVNATTYTVDAADRLTSMTRPNDSLVTFTYDADGNLLTDTRKERSYTWNALGQLSGIQVAKPVNAAYTVNFTYDPLGRRTSMVNTKNSISRAYLYDGISLLSDSNAVYLHGAGIDQPLELTAAGSTLSYLQDHLGSTTKLLDGSDSIITKYTYNPYGKLTVNGAINPNTSNPFGYTGREDDGTGLLYLRARYYDPTIQRFISDDPLGQGQRYAFGSPLLYRDPSGLWAGFDDATAIISGGVVGVLGQAASDIVSNKGSGLNDYIASFAGGAAGAETLLYTIPTLGVYAPYASGAAGGLIGNGTKQILNKLTSTCSLDYRDLVNEGAFGALLGGAFPSLFNKVPGIGNGIVNNAPLLKQLPGKLATVKNMLPKTAGSILKGIDTHEVFISAIGNYFGYLKSVGPQ